jgi:hypothetical protein
MVAISARYTKVYNSCKLGKAIFNLILRVFTSAIWQRQIEENDNNIDFSLSKEQNLSILD